jgi:hypothetical protein
LALSSHAPGDKQGSARASGGGVSALVDRALNGPAGPDDEGSYRLIDPIGPGGATSSAAAAEVFAQTMVGGIYTRWEPYHDPFDFPGQTPNTGGPYGPHMPEYPQ